VCVYKLLKKKIAVYFTAIIIHRISIGNKLCNLLCI